MITITQALCYSHGERVNCKRWQSALSLKANSKKENLSRGTRASFIVR